MTINRYNYQEYFLLYTDNELSAAERKVVEEFVQQNPDMAEELKMLTDAVFVPDEKVVFDKKEVLYQFDNSANLIHPGNFEEFAVRFTDDELTPDDKLHLDRFLIDNPNFQQEFELIKTLKLVADDSITFPDKTILYRSEKERRAVVLPWWRMAAAAVVLLFLGGLWYNSNNNTTTTPDPKLAEITKSKSSQAVKTAETPGVNKQSPAKSANNATVPGDIATTKSLAVDVPGDNEDVHAGKKPALVHTSNSPALKNDVAATYKAKLVTENKITTGQPPLASVKIAGNSKVDLEKSTETAALVEATIEDKSRKLLDAPEVKLNPAKTDNYTFASMVANHEIDEDVSENLADRKTPLRGLIRKASRFIDKTTSSRTSKRSGILIGNIEIALQ